MTNATGKEEKKKASRTGKSGKLYKDVKSKKVTVKKPNHDEYITFTYNQKENTRLLKTFVKYIVTDVREVNLLKNDMGFLINEIYGQQDYMTNLTVPVEDGTVFYVWTYLPYNWDENVSTPADIKTEIFAFDLFYIRLPLSMGETKNIITFLKDQVDAKVYTRKVGDAPQLPFDVMGG
jgi:hypothetical protein